MHVRTAASELRTVVSTKCGSLLPTNQEETLIVAPQTPCYGMSVAPHQGPRFNEKPVGEYGTFAAWQDGGDDFNRLERLYKSSKFWKR